MRKHKLFGGLVLTLAGALAGSSPNTIGVSPNHMEDTSYCSVVIETENPKCNNRNLGDLVEEQNSFTQFCEDIDKKAKEINKEYNFDNLFKSKDKTEEETYKMVYDLLLDELSDKEKIKIKKQGFQLIEKIFNKRLKYEFGGPLFGKNKLTLAGFTKKEIEAKYEVSVNFYKPTPETKKLLYQAFNESKK